MIFRYDFNNVHHLACSEVLEMIDPQKSMIEILISRCGKRIWQIVSL